MHRNGVPKQAVDCLFTTLQNATHQVRTGYGDSSSSYGGPNWITPMHGIGQGNGAGPAIWAVLSSPLLNLLRSKGFGCEFLSPFSKEALHFVGYAFADDTDVIVSQTHMNSHIEAIQTLQRAVNTWEGGLKATCGAIVPEKTFWYLIDFTWSGGRWHYKSVEDSPGSILLNDIEGIPKELRRCEVHDAQDTLGIFLAPDGNTLQQQKKMKELAIQWADCMRTGRISRDDAWLSFYSTIWKTLSYPLPALNLSKEECEKIMALILQYLLPAMGICRTFTRALVYNSVKYMGIGIHHPYTIQEILRIKDILRRVHKHSTTGKLYRSSLEVLILEIGMGEEIQNLPEDVVDTLATDSLVKSTCQFLQKYDLTLLHDIKIKPLREDDQLIMKAFYALSPTSSELMALNRCRLYLQVLFLSEICTGDGLAISGDAWVGKCFEVPHKQESWPRQQRPSHKDWTIWQLFIKKAFIVRGLRLRVPLSNWLTCEDGWEWFFSPSQECLFKLEQGKWISYSQVHKRDRLPTFSNPGTPANPPSDLNRATIYFRKTKLYAQDFPPSLLFPTLQWRHSPNTSSLLHLEKAGASHIWTSVMMA
jgi:hypothetical protein